MYVCICNKVTERDIQREIRDGAYSMSCLVDRLAVSTSCGKCDDAARECLEGRIDRDLDAALGATA